VKEHPRIAELRRRVQADPASLSFAPLAEECRRAGSNEEAVAICRAGLAHHPQYLGARVTLGRALIELDQLDEAFAELTSVLDAAPGHLAAIRALAEIYQRRGMMNEAMVHYRRALELAPDETGSSATVDEVPPLLEAPPQVETPPAAASTPIADLFDFDALLAQLETPHAGASPPAYVPLNLSSPTPLDTAAPPADDVFAVMEQQLREREELRVAEEKQARQAEAERYRAAVLEELEGWLSAITSDRQQHSA
jgi:tetratricopeptide (TPR) repeat protein